MGKTLSLIGYFILLFVVITNFINISLSNTGIIILTVFGAIFMSTGILMKNKSDN